MNEQVEYLFYDGPYDALEKSIAQSGKPKKQIASAVYPGRQCDTAKSLLSRAMSPENSDVRISIENLLVIMKETRAEDFIYFLCDEFGFERPVKRLKKDVKRQIQEELAKISARMAQLTKSLPQLED
jgi:hypothetical protein